MQHLIAGLMAVCVVDVFKMVDVDHQNRKRTMIALIFQVTTTESVHNGKATGYAGNGIGIGLALELKRALFDFLLQGFVGLFQFSSEGFQLGIALAEHINTGDVDKGGHQAP